MCAVLLSTKLSKIVILSLSIKLQESEVVEYSFICGEHLSEKSFDDNGRLKRDSIKIMLSYKECLTHHHNYNKTEEVGHDKGKTIIA